MEMPEGTAYDYVEPNGTHRGLHPTYGRILGSWHVDSAGETCVTWNYPAGAITNCGSITNLGDGKYEWGDRTLVVKRGDVQKLGQ